MCVLNHPGPRTELPWNYFVHCGPRTTISCVFIATVVLGLRWQCVHLAVFELYLSTLVLGLRWRVCFEPIWS